MPFWVSRKEVYLWQIAKKLIFNLDVLDYCGKHIKNKRLYKLNSYGMELGDIEQLVSEPGAVTDACVEMEGILSKIIDHKHKPGS